MGRVAIIGAGVSGLVSAKVLQQDGFAVTVFDKDEGVGGVWAASRAYPGLRTNNPAPTYAFSDFPHFDDTDEFPTAAQLRAYFATYIERFGLGPHLRLGTEVVSVAREEGTFGLRVTLRDGTSERFDRVVVANGVLSVPNMPGLPGAEHFAGTIRHSSEITDGSALRGRRVVVVGAGKSAMDMACLAGREAAACTLVFRRPYWMLPRYFSRRRVDAQVFNRLTETLTFPAYHRASRGEVALRCIGAPLLRAFRRLQCRVVARAAGMPGDMVPEFPIHAGIYHQGIGADIYQALREGRVTTRRDGIASFRDKHTLQLDSGETLETDIVVCATGWQQRLDFLDAPLQEAVLPDGRFRLYRHILPPAEPRLGFVGYASSGNTPLSSELAAHWLSEYFLGGLRLPERVAMEREIDRVLAWSARVFPEQPAGHFIGGYIAHYADELLRDLGLPTRRASGRLAELLRPLTADRYNGLGVERFAAR